MLCIESRMRITLRLLSHSHRICELHISRVKIEQNVYLILNLSLTFIRKSNFLRLGSFLRNAFAEISKRFWVRFEAWTREAAGGLGLKIEQTLGNSDRSRDVSFAVLRFQFHRTTTLATISIFQKTWPQNRFNLDYDSTILTQKWDH